MHRSLPSSPLRRHLLAATALLPTIARAQAAGERPLKMIVGYPPGGSADILARIIGQRLSLVLGRPVLVDNRAGAGGQISLDATAPRRRPTATPCC